MKGIGWWLVEETARALEPRDRDAVLGDLAEAGETAWRGLLDVLGLLIRRQAVLWTNWRPWLAAFGLALPGSLLLMGLSVSISQTGQQFLDPKIFKAAGLRSDPAFWLLLSQIVLLTGWSWTGGLVAGRVSRRTIWATAASSVLPCMFCLTRFRIEDMSRFCLLLFLPPAIWGVRRGLRGAAVKRAPAIALALALTALTAPTWGSRGAWISTCALSWPVWFLAIMGRRKSSGTARGIATILACLLSGHTAYAAAPAESETVSREIQSRNLANSKIGVNPLRKLAIYLPAGYASSSKRYPVVYFFASPFDSSFRAIFDQMGAREVLDRAIAAGTIHEFIFVTVDMTTPVGCSWYVNSTATGNWEDFMVQEVVPYIDTNFRTLAARESRGIAGHFMGGYGAIRFGMKYPQVFGSVYALHPVGTGSGVKILASLPNFELMENAKTLADIQKDGYSTIFTSIFEAHIPDPKNPPLYIEFPAHRAGGRLMVDAQVMDRLRNNFFLESLVGQYADNLKSLRGFKFDWARSDLNWDHVYSNQAFTHKLNEYGIVHEAEEYNGTWDREPNWGADGRITTDMLPFFQRHLVF